MKTPPIKRAPRATFAPNVVLPKGAAMLPKPVKLKLGGWNELIYDACLNRLDLVWYRVKGGIGGDNRGETWLADVLSVALSVHEYHWNATSSIFPKKYASFNAAILGETRNKIAHAEGRVADLEAKLADANAGLLALRNAVECRV